MEFLPNSVVIKTIIRKTACHVSAVIFDSGQLLDDDVSRFDILIQVVAGTAEITIDKRVSRLQKGASVIIPAYAHSTLKAIGQLKIISTTIKSADNK